MNSVSVFFLRAKHWLVFSLLFGIPLVGEIAIMTYIATKIASPEKLFANMSLAVGFLTVVSVLPMLGWFWALGSFLNSIAQPQLKMKFGFFKFALLYPALYIFVFLAAFQSLNPLWFAVIFPLHLIAIYCMFYCLYFVSKSLALVEMNRPVSFSDYAASFFLLWFYPIGIWIIQPKINLHYESFRQENKPRPMSL
jgi:hypothetical protein